MATIQIKNWDTQEVIFEYKAENATLKDAVEEAIRQDISLAFADLSAAYLMDADLSGANLKDANLYNAYIRYADLNGAQLSNVNLRYADLYSANLKDAYLREAYLTGASLKYANLEGANLSNADLKGANLSDADLRGANFRDTNFEGANLYNIDLRLAKNIPDDLMPLACPAEGSFIAWKKVYETDFDNGDKLVKLEIPEDAKRSSATTNKCRCSKAKVLAITNLKETESFDEVFNNNYAPLTYKVGEIVYPDFFDEDRWYECSHGIHFFMDKEDALNW